MSTLANDKQIACDAIDKDSKNLRAISLNIWENPELCFKEHNAHNILTDYLEKKGFKVINIFFHSLKDM